MSGEGDPVITAQELTGALTTLSGRLEDATRYGHRNRKMIWGLVVSIVLDVALTVTLTLVAVQAQNAGETADQARANQISVCRSTNVSRQQNLQLWEYVLSIPPAKPPTEEQKKQREAFRAYIHKVFAPRDCNRL